MSDIRAGTLLSWWPGAGDSLGHYALVLRATPSRIFIMWTNNGSQESYSSLVIEDTVDKNYLRVEVY